MTQGRDLGLLEVTGRVLEVGAVYARLAGFTQTPMGAALIRRRRPLADPASIEARHDEWEEARRLAASRGTVGLSGAQPLGALLREASTPGRILDGAELLVVAASAAAAVELQRHLRVAEAEYPQLGALGAKLPDLDALVRQVGSLVTAEGAVRDDASPELTRIRGRSARLRGRLRERLESLTRDEAVRDALRDPIVSERGGRLVVPVRPGQRDRVKGIVHDTSSSGQTLWVEPLDSLEDQNRLAELDGEAREEVRRLLADATAHVRAAAPALAVAEEAIARVDMLQALVRWATAVEGTRPVLVDEGYLLRGGRHPLVESDFVPLDLEVPVGTRALVLTGPNTGGKTVALKTIGLLALLGQAGIPVPAVELRFAPWGWIHADIGDEQSLTANLSTFSAHLHHIASFLDAGANPPAAGSAAPALILLDELGTGTDPQEGAALGIALLERFLERGDWVVASTHHDALKSFAHRHEGAINAAMEFDPDSLSPTYRIRVGEPGRSNALEIAARLGFDRALIDRARSLLGADAVHLDDVIRELERERETAREATTSALGRERELEREREELARAEAARAARFREIEQEARAALREAADEVRRKGTERLKELEPRKGGTTVSDTQRADRRARWSTEAGAVEAEQRRALERRLSASRPPAAAVDPAPAESFSPGDRVKVAPFGFSGVILTAAPDGPVEVDVDGKRLIVDAAQLERAPAGSPSPRHGGRKRVRTRYQERRAVKSEIDLHGCTVEEALERVDRYLDDALLSDLDTVRLIHGFGTFALRDAIRSFLSGRPGIASFGPADPMQGGAGVTVVRLAGD